MMIAIGLLAAGGSAVAQTPSPEQLWDAYPLEPGSEKAEPPDPAPTPTPTLSLPPERERPTVVVKETSDGGGASTLLLAGGAAMIFGIGIGAGTLVRRRRRDQARATVPVEPKITTVPSPRPAPSGARVSDPPAPKRAPKPRRAKPKAKRAPKAKPKRTPKPAPRSRPTPDASAKPARRPAAEFVPTAPAPVPPQLADPPLPPAARFARRRPWPLEAAKLWTCQIEWKAGYRKSTFRAMAAAPGADRREAFGDSAPVKWTLMGDPDPPTPATADALRGLIGALQDQGWERIEPAGPWYAQRLVWRQDGQPRPIAPLTRKAVDA